MRRFVNENSNFIFVELDTNLGLGAAQNIGCSKLKEMNAKYVVLFDQDTIVDESFLEMAMENYNIAKQRFSNIGVLVPIYYDKQRKKVAEFTARYSGKYRKTSIRNDFQKISFANASGMIFDLELVREIGGMREDFFIDQIDVEFCERVTQNGFDIIATKQLKIIHTVGEGTVTKIGSLEVQHSNHNDVRRYYIAKNSIILNKLYPNDKEFVKLINKRLVKTIFVCFLEKNSIQKILAIFRGVRDGLRYEV
ncbi:hypothetical protein RV01_GL001047 [Enterococcus dispar]|nr:hypothetical protein RV01_GL001047 [Enterococcus dispar]